jgi:hypothetical protein
VSAAWIVAAGVLTTLVVVLSAGLITVMSRLAEVEAKASRLQGRLDHLQLNQRTQQQRETPPPPPPLASVIVLLEASRERDVALAEDLRRTGRLPITVPARIYVTDDEAGGALVDGLAADVAPLHRDAPLSEAFPSVVALDEHGAVLMSGSPDSVEGLVAIASGRGRTQ